MWERVELTVLLGAPSETFSDGLENQRERERERESVCVFYEIEEASSSERERSVAVGVVKSLKTEDTQMEEA